MRKYLSKRGSSKKVKLGNSSNKSLTFQQGLENKICKWVSDSTRPTYCFSPFLLSIAIWSNVQLCPLSKDTQGHFGPLGAFNLPPNGQVHVYSPPGFPLLPFGPRRVPMSHFLTPSCPHPSPASQHNQCLTAVSSASPGSFTQSSSSIILSVCRSSRPSHSNLWVWKVFPEERAEDDSRPWWIITGLRPGLRGSCRGWAAMVAGELMGEVVPGRERWVWSPPFEEASEGLVGLKKSWGLVLISHTTRSSPKLELTEIVEDKTVKYFVELKAKRLSQPDVKINQVVKMLLLITHSKMVKEKKSGNLNFFQNGSPCARSFSLY